MDTLDKYKKIEDQEREKEIRKDVFNPNESDLEYFLRRKRELEQRKN